MPARALEVKKKACMAGRSGAGPRSLRKKKKAVKAESQRGYD